MMSTRYLPALIILLVTALLTACGRASAIGDDDTDAPVATTTVQVVDNDFEPANAEVTAGDTMTWQWAGANQHNVVVGDVASAVQDAGTFEHTFTEPGTYEYRCTLHGGMRGTVTVVPADAEDA
ncbi:MAG TPA: plastocyanin/azurin family copper-binding protein [Euzebyales bacterium]